MNSQYSFDEKAASHLYRRVCVIVLFGLSLGLHAQTQPRLEDPLFGIDIDPQHVMLETAPSNIPEYCHELRGRKLWVFARSKANGVRYYILNGLLEHRADVPQPQKQSYESDFGLGVVLQGPRCTVVPADQLMTGKIHPYDGGGQAVSVPEPVLIALSTDVLRRMTNAFGGKDKFKPLLSQAVAAHDAYQAKLPPSLRFDYPPILRKHVNEYLRE